MLADGFTSGGPGGAVRSKLLAENPQEPGE